LMGFMVSGTKPFRDPHYPVKYVDTTVSTCVEFTV
jgi:hypothetical protein